MAIDKETKFGEILPTTEGNEVTALEEFEYFNDQNRVGLDFFADIQKPLNPRIWEYCEEITEIEKISEQDLKELITNYSIWMELAKKEVSNSRKILKALEESISERNLVEAKKVLGELVPHINAARENHARIGAIKENLPRLQGQHPSLYLTVPFYEEYAFGDLIDKLKRVLSDTDTNFSELYVKAEKEVQEISPEQRADLSEKLYELMFESFVKEAKENRQWEEKNATQAAYVSDYAKGRIAALSDENLAKAKEIIIDFYKNGDYSEAINRLKAIDENGLSDIASYNLRANSSDFVNTIILFENFDQVLSFIKQSEVRKSQLLESEKDSYQIGYEIKQLDQRVADFKNMFIGLDIRLFASLMESETTEKIFGKEKTDQVKSFLQDMLLDKLMVLNDHNDEAINAGRQLLSFKTPEAVRINLINAFRESGYSGEMPFINRLPEYLASLTEEEIESIKAKSPKEVIELADFIRKNPDCLSTTMGDSIEKNERYQKNREMRALLNNLARQFFEEGDEKDKFFVLKVIHRFPTTDDEEGRKRANNEYLQGAGKLLRESEDQRIKSSIIDGFKSYEYGDEEEAREASLILLENYDKLGGTELQAQALLDNLFLGDNKGVCRVDEKGFEAFGKVHGVTKEQVIAAKEIVELFAKSRNENTFNYSLYLREENLQGLLEVAGNEGFSDFAEEILANPTGYEDSEANKSLIIYFLSNPKLLTSSEDVSFMRTAYKNLGENNFWLFLDYYQENIQDQGFSKEKRGEFLEFFKQFKDNLTKISVERIEDFQVVAASELGLKVRERLGNSDYAFRVMLDLAYYQNFDNKVKFLILSREIENFSDKEKFNSILESLRWLTEDQVSEDDTEETLSQKLGHSIAQFKEGFESFAKEVQGQDSVSAEYQNVRKIYDDLISGLGMTPKQFKFPVEFLRELGKIKRDNPDALPIVELTGFIAKKILEKGSSYTVGDIFYEQLGDLQDKTGRQRRKSSYSPEQLIGAMEKNINASATTWRAALLYQQENPSSPLFLLANERTAPADVAAEFLPQAFAKEQRILQDIRTEEIKNFTRSNASKIESAYADFIKDGSTDAILLEKAKEAFGFEKELIIPVYGLKVPSSLNGAKDEPRGMDEYITFLKLVSMMKGRCLFMDESTRSAPRSIECLYNVLNRRQEDLGGVNLRFFGKAKGANGQNGTILTEITPRLGHMEVGFIDPWSDSEKPINDDSYGFVPEISGTAGFVEIIKPSNAAISRSEGISTIQNLWKAMIAGEVSQRVGVVK